MIVRIRPDKQKSESLRKMAEVTLQRLDNTDMEQYPSNTLLDYYEVIHKLIEALTLRKGIKIKGEGAHQELIEYAAKEKMIDEQARQFLQQMRDYRNRISYEGFMVPKNYVSLNKEKIQKIIRHLFDMPAS
ncbi:MAG: HEPN domain-containing protein [Candidatus Woesearchaeota archaeon]|nr:HEPN domain-containing protein [Candidatus Woesearchaeota archaeon]